jgi:ParB family chromosome partitioning protein
VRPHGDGYQLVSGERRWRAAQLAQLTEVPIVVRNYSDRDMLEIALVENLQREDINPLEAARAYMRLMQEFGLTQEEVAQRVGKSRSAVANTIRLLNLEGPIQNSLAEGKITEGHARALLAIPDSERRLEVWRQMLESGASVRDAEAAARAEKERASTATTRRVADSDPNVADIEHKLSHQFGTKVRIHRNSKGRGRLTIEFYSDEELERILELLGFLR